MGIPALKHTVGTTDRRAEKGWEGTEAMTGVSGDRVLTSITPVSSNAEISWTLGLMLCLIFLPHKMS